MTENRSTPLNSDVPIRERQLLTGPLFSEPMQMETVRSNGPDVWVADLIGQRSRQIRRVRLTSEDISDLIIEEMLCGSQVVIRRSEVFA